MKTSVKENIPISHTSAFPGKHVTDDERIPNVSITFKISCSGWLNYEIDTSNDSKKCWKVENTSNPYQTLQIIHENNML